MRDHTSACTMRASDADAVSPSRQPSTRLSQLGLSERTQFTYEHDFGDSWTHRIEVRTISPGANRAELVPAPLLVDGRRAAPPEDCGGPPGSEELLRVLADPSDPEHTDMHTRVGPDFDTERFDARATRPALIMAAVGGALRYVSGARCTPCVW